MYKHRKTFLSVLILFLLISSNSFAKTYKWDDFTKPFKEKMGYIDISRPAKIAVHLPEFIKNYKSIPLIIISDIIDEETKALLHFNDQIWQIYTFSQSAGLNSEKIKIKTRNLKPGLNILHFENRDGYGSLYTIEEIRFDLTDMALPKDISTIFDRKHDTEKPQRTEKLKFILKDKNIKIGITEFKGLNKESRKDNLGEIISEIFTTSFIKSNAFKNVEKGKLKKNLKELKQRESSIINTSYAKEIGEMAEVDAVVTGGVVKIGNYLRLDVRIIDADSGIIITAEKMEGTVDIKSIGAIVDQIVTNLVNSLCK